MQVAEVTGVLEREDAAGAVLLPFVGTGRPGEENPHLCCGIGFTNDVVMRGNTDTTFNRPEKDIHVVGLRTQTFQFQTERRTTPAIGKQAPAFPRMGNPLMKLVAQFMNVLKAMYTAVYCIRCSKAVTGSTQRARASIARCAGCGSWCPTSCRLATWETLTLPPTFIQS